MLVLILALIWRRSGPIVPGTALAAAVAAFTLLLVRADRSSRGERVVWLTVATALLICEASFAYRVHRLAQSVVVGHLLSDGKLALVHWGGDAVLSGVSIYVMDLDGLEKLQNQRVENDAQYKPLIQSFHVGEYKPNDQMVLPMHKINAAGPLTHYRVVFYSKDTSWWEDLQTTEQGGQLLQAYRVVAYRGLGPKVLLEYQDPRLTQLLPAGPDWTWAKREP